MDALAAGLKHGQRMQDLVVPFDAAGRDPELTGKVT